MVSLEAMKKTPLLVLSSLAFSILAVSTQHETQAAPSRAAPPVLVQRPTAAPARAPLLEVDADGDDSDDVHRVAPAQRLPSLDISCMPGALKLDWPLAGTPGTTWVTNNYTDLDPSGGLMDWKGGSGAAAITYDGHRGYDIDVGSFREMDGNKVLARAAAYGKVIARDESHGDRNTSCSSEPWNYVAVEHLNGFVSYYGHLKRNSITVDVGDKVYPGDPLGTVGSSGCSTTPHLHFEVRDCNNQWFDPARVPGMWKVSPAQLEVSGIMDVMLRAGGISSSGQIKNPAPNPTVMTPGTLGIGLSAALRDGDEVMVLVLNGTWPDAWTWKSTGRYGHRMPSWNVQVEKGPAQIYVWVNDELKVQRTINVQ